MRKRLLNLFMSALLLIGGLTTTQAQTAAQYNFSASSGTYTPLSGGTSIISSSVDDAVVNDIPIGFAFKFAGTDYTYASVSSNGFLVLATTLGVNISNLTFNNEDFGSIGKYPILAPLWDDLQTYGVDSKISYQLTGVSPNRILIVEWKDMLWDLNASGPVISFQAKLYEGSNKIEYIYKPSETQAVSTTSVGATIGICSAENVYLSLNNSSASPTVSSSVLTFYIVTKPANGQIYTFTGSPIAPTITGISPTSGPTAGGTSVTITGTDFSSVTAVKFGSTNASSYIVNSTTSITATSPAGSGTTDITVTTAGGTSATSSADHFTYVAAPTVTSILPTSGPIAGGTAVTITGTNLTGATAVNFGGIAGSITANTATSITATSPAGSAGAVDITVTTAGGTSATSSADHFTYVATPTVTGISPTSGSTAGGTAVTITGTNLTGDVAVKFGSNAATISANTATSITATSPAGLAGTIDITVTTAGGTSSTNINDKFTYVTAPSFTSTPVTTVNYNQPYNYNVAATTEGGLATTITAPTLPAWLTLNGNQSAGVAKAIGNIPADVEILSATLDSDGNIYAITYTNPNTIYKITPDGTTTVWKSGIIGGQPDNLLISNGYIYIPREGNSVNSLTRIPIANPNATEELFVSLPGGIAGLTEKDGWIYGSIYSASKIVRINESTRVVETVLTSANGCLGICFDNNGNLLIATHSNRKVLKYDGSSLTPVLANLPNTVTSVKVDKQGNTYVGLWGGGLRKYKPDFSSFETVSVNADDAVWAISMSETGAIAYSVLFTNLVYLIESRVSLQGTPAKSDVGAQNVVLRAANSAGYTDQTFTINVVDNVAPVLSTHSPVTNATNIDLKPTLSLTFDEDVSLGSTGILSIYNGASIVKSYDLSVTADKALFTLSSDKKTVSITLTENLPVNTVLSVGLGAGFVKDKYDNNFAGFTAGSNTWQFTTINKVAQTITFPAIDAKTYGDADFTLGNATTDKGLTVTYTAADPTVVSITGNQATILKAGNTNITATQTGDNVTFAATQVEHSLSVSKALLTVKADNKSKVYDGQVANNLTVAYTGFVKDETATALTGTLSFTGTAVTAVTAGLDYVVTPSGYSSNNYTITYENGKLDISKRPITLTADAKSKTYGDTDPSLTAQVTLGTIVTGDNASGSLTRATGETAADYAISKGTYTYGSNYSETFVPANLTIGKRAITLTADAKSKTYGDTDPSLTAQVTLGTIVTGDNASGSLSRATGGTVADYAISKGTYTYGSNYSETFVPANLTIGKRVITLTADAKSKTYGDTDPSLSAQVTSGTIVPGDNASGSLTRAIGESTGQYAINKGTYTYGSNYNETYVSKDFTISKRSLTVTAKIDSKTYDGTTKSSQTPIVGALVTGDAINVVPIQLFDNANVGNNHVLTPTGLTLKNGTNNVTDNYLITYNTLSTGVIAAKQLTISNPTVITNKTVDGNASAAITKVGTLTGVETTDANNVTVAAVANYNNAAVGTGKTITVVYTLNGSAKGNYIAPANFVITNCKISDVVTLSPLLTPSPGCEGSGLNLDYSILTGTPTQYKITFDAAANSAGIQNVAYTDMTSSSTSGTLMINVPKKTVDGTYHGTLVMRDELGVESPAYSFTFTINLSADYILTKFNQIIFVDNSSKRFTAYQWYKDGVIINGATKQSYNDPTGLSGAYTVQVTDTKGNKIISCPKVLNNPKAVKVVAYPNPVKSSRNCTVQVSGLSGKDLENAELSVYTPQGVCIYQSSKVELLNSLNLPTVDGVYIGQLKTADGDKHLFKVVVIK